MKVKYLFLAVFATILAISCSKDEVVEVSDSNSIKFSVSSGKMTRADDVFCNYNYPGSFTVWANHVKENTTPTTYIDGDVITSSDGTTWTNSSGIRYWPKDGTLDFYAHVNGETFNYQNGAPTVAFTVKDNVTEQQDFLYAVKKEQTKAASPVALNFRHALSQVVFKAKNTNENLKVTVQGVKVVNVNSTGTFTFPTGNTDGNVQNHTGAGTYPSTGLGSWASQGTKKTYSTTFTAINIPGDNTVVSLTDGTDDNDNSTPENWNNVMLLVPQAITPWAPETEAPKTTPNTYFIVNYTASNIANSTETELFSGEAAIPATSITWEQGKKYIYTFIFGEGGGGYPPENPDPDPDPIFTEITLSVTIDDFVSATGQDIEMAEE